MKCQRCARPAVVHLTEIVSNPGPKHTMEVHLCLGHAVEAGLVIPSADVPPQVLAMQGPHLAEKMPTAIVPSPADEAMGLVVARGGKLDASTCPICGTTWNQFKQTGAMGCPHDYELFAGKIIPLLKRAQEGASDHVGKVPPRKQTPDAERQVVSLRLRRELQKAVDAEKYEEAANLRDQLRQLERN